MPPAFFNDLVHLWPPGFDLNGGKPGGVDVPVDHQTGVWRSDVLPFPPGGQYTVNAQIYRQGKPVGEPVLRHFYVAVEIAQSQQELALVLHQVQPIVGRGYPGAKVVVTRGGDTLCTVDPIGSSGDWSCGQYPTDTLGDYIVTVTHTLSGVPQSSNAVHVTVGPPPATIDAPVENAVVTTATYTLSGTGVPGADVVLDTAAAPPGAGDLLRWAMQVDDTGYWQSSALTAVAGSYSVTATQYIDGMAQATPTPRDYTVTVQGTQISQPTGTQPVPAGLLTVQGTAQPEATLQLADCSGGTLPDCTGGVLINRTVTATDGGNWSTTYLAVPGPHALSVQAYTASIAAGQPVTVSYTAQGSATRVSINTPYPQQQISTPSYAIAGTGQPGASVTVSGAGLPTHANIPVDTSGQWTTTYVSQAGSYTATASQTGPDGVATWNSSDSVAYTVAASPANVGIDDPRENATVAASYAIQGSGQPTATVTLTGAGSNVCYTTVDAQGKWNCGPYTLAPGAYTVTATQWIGNLQAGPPARRDYAVQAAAAPVVISSPTPSQIITDAVYTINGTAAPGASVTVSALGLPDSGPIAVRPDGTWSHAYLAKTGTYTAVATQTIGGKDAGTSTPVTYQVQADATALTISSPWENQVLDQSPYTITGSGEPGASVTMSPPQDGSPCQVTVGQNKQWSCGPYDTGAGTFWVRATQSVMVNNQPQQVGDPVLRHYSVVPQQEPSPPVAEVEIDAPMQNQVVRVPYTVSGKGQAGMQVSVSGAGLPTHSDIDVNPDGTWSTIYGPDSPLTGSFTITATQTLNNQPQGTSPPRAYQVQAAAVTIDNPAPNATVDVPYTVSGQAQYGTTVTVSGAGLPTYANIPVSEQGVWFQVYGDGTPTRGDFTIQATQYGGTQSLGSSTPVPYHVGGTVSVAIDAPLEGENVYLPYTISGTGTAGDTVKVEIAGISPRSAPVLGDGTWSLIYTANEDPNPPGARAAVATQYAGSEQTGQTPPRNFTLVAGPAPAALIIFPRDGTELRTNGRRLYPVMGTAAAGGQVTVSQKGGQGGPVTVDVDEGGNWNTGAIFTPPPPINDAQHCTRNHSSCKSDPGTVTATEYYGGQKINEHTITVYGVVTFN
ncbi:Bacterial Ig-like domain-containing protein [Bordetella sputigena]